MSRPYEYNKLLQKIYSEEYCCLAGYLRLCEARGQSVKSMAEYQEVSARVIYYHRERLEQGKLKCANRRDCMETEIQSIKASKD